MEGSKPLDIAPPVAAIDRLGGGNGRHMVNIVGKIDHTTDGESMVDHILEMMGAELAE